MYFWKLCLFTTFWGNKSLTPRQKQKGFEISFLNMDRVINIGVPHIAKKIFEHLDIHGLIRCMYVSGTWRQLAEESFVNRLSEADQADENGRNPVMVACIFGYTYVLQILLDYSQSENIDLNCVSYYDLTLNTPLMFACENGHEDAVKLLLDYSGSQFIDFNHQCSEKRTAFMLACKGGHLEVVRLLLDYSENKSIVLKKQDKV